MKKVLFVLHNMCDGGAQRVLVNLVNHLNYEKYDITVFSIFEGGVNVPFLRPEIHYRGYFKKIFRGNIHLLKLYSPQKLYQMIIGERYDIAIAYLEGLSTRIIAGCPYQDTRLVAWIHVEQLSLKRATVSYRSESEARECYHRFDRVIAVANTVKMDFESIFQFTDRPVDVLYNTNESDRIRAEAAMLQGTDIFSSEEINIISVGRVREQKGFDRLAKIHLWLKEAGYPVHTYILGTGPQQQKIQRYTKKYHVDDTFTFLGYDTNPYKYVACADLFVCSSRAEGFSTAATEALIVGTPVCTVEVSGMKEMLGESNEYGIVTENTEEALYQGIRTLLDDPSLLAHYAKQAALRGRDFSTEETVGAVEEMLDRL